MSTRLGTTAWMVLALAAGAIAAPALAQPKHPGESCFLSRDWSNWRPGPDAKTIYLRVGVSEVFRLDLESACPELKEPDARLITKIRGSDWICSPLDLDIRVASGPPPSIDAPCLVKGMSRLTPDEVAALPKGARP